MGFYKYFVFLIGVFLLIPVGGASFTDVSSSYLHFDAIDYVQKNGIVDGYSDGSFRPDDFVNRAEFTKIIVGSVFDYKPSPYEKDLVEYSLKGLFNFSDVEFGEWYVPYVRKALENGIVSGYPDGTFRPGDDINFVEAAKIIVEGFGYDIEEDDSLVWYKKYVDVLSEKKAIVDSVDSFEHKVTRGELAEMIYRLKGNITVKSSITYDDLVKRSFKFSCEGEKVGHLKDFYFCYDSKWGVIESSLLDNSKVTFSFLCKDCVKNDKYFPIVPRSEFVNVNNIVGGFQLSSVFPFNLSWQRGAKLKLDMSDDDILKLLNLDSFGDDVSISRLDVDGHHALKIVLKSEKSWLFDIDANVVGYVIFDVADGVNFVSYIDGDYVDRLDKFVNGFKFGKEDLFDIEYLNDHVEGRNYYADVSLIVYTDFVCPFCAKFHSTVQELFAKYDGKINVVYRNFPLKFHDPEATKFANVLECVASYGNNNSYFYGVGRVFDDGLSYDDLLNENDDVYGLVFEDCVSSEKFAGKIADDIKSGKGVYGIVGTPTTVVMDNRTGEFQVVDGARSVEFFEGILDEMLR